MTASFGRFVGTEAALATADDATQEEPLAVVLSKQDLFGTRLCDKVQAQVGLARAEALMRSARTYGYAEVAQSGLRRPMERKYSSGRQAE